MEAMYKEHGDKIEFYIVYIREAHPNNDYPQPETYEGRTDHAETLCDKLEISIPTLIDKIDNKVGSEYSGFPDRIYLVGQDGKIAYKGGRGPFHFKPKELGKEIEKELKKIGIANKDIGIANKDTATSTSTTKKGDKSK